MAESSRLPYVDGVVTGKRGRGWPLVQYFGLRDFHCNKMRTV